MHRQPFFPMLVAFAFGCMGAPGQTLDIIGVTQLRLAEPALIGTGVNVAQPEAPSGDSWQVNPNAVGQPASLFTFQSNSGTAATYPNSVGTESGHADAVGDNFFGKTNVTNPEGVAPGVSHVYAYDANFFYQNRVVPQTTIAAKVVNQSFTFSGQDASIDQQWDQYAARFNTIFVSGVGNGGPPNSPATAYDCIGVAAYGGASSIGPTSDGRCKPDITAPAYATSFSTPYVSGAATLLVQAALRNDGGASTSVDAADSRTIKALLLNGANKPGDWTHTATSPLDFRYGAGVVNVLRSHDLLKGGKHLAGGTFTTPASLRGWAKATITGNPLAVHHYNFTLSSSLGSRFELVATLVWNRNQNETGIKNLDLALYDTTTGSPVFGAVSTSAVDNVEHIWSQEVPPGNYDLRVIKNATGSLLLPDETYSLAFKFSPQAPTGIRVTGFPTGANPQVTFVAPGNLSFRLEAKADADDAVQPWTLVGSGSTSPSGTTVVADPGSVGQLKRTYRVVIVYP